ncbi:hypothetical protein OIU83_03050 [Flavobacterium sp. LS1R49]|uniref:Uncharacterized protein n=1 Tax=Flavobacterium shii TaxID=2987687 RepID=A0A9X3C6H4_9FLAO|nr:hypothetical protein [Flavobacterium shii]MCV9926608.1 hypothetical protein [Flavobacterium shii]
MGNEETDEKRRITPEKVFKRLQAKRLDLTLQRRKRKLCKIKSNGGKKQGKLTIEELRRCKGFDEISESEANELIDSLFQLAIIIYNLKE